MSFGQKRGAVKSQRRHRLQEDQCQPFSTVRQNKKLHIYTRQPFLCLPPPSPTFHPSVLPEPHPHPMADSPQRSLPHRNRGVKKKDEKKRKSQNARLSCLGSSIKIERFRLRDTTAVSVVDLKPGETFPSSTCLRRGIFGFHQIGISRSGVGPHFREPFSSKVVCCEKNCYR